MSLLLGSETVETTVITGSQGQIEASGPWTATASKPVGSMTWASSATASTSKKQFYAIAKDAEEGGVHFPGEIIGVVERNATITASKNIIIEGWSCSTVEGQKYWLLALFLEGAGKMLGHETTGGESTERQSTLSTFTSLENAHVFVKGDWKSALAKGPMQWWVATAAAGSPVLNLGPSLSSSGARTGTGAPRMSLGPSLGVAGHQSEAGPVALKLGPSLATTAARTGTGSPKMNLGVRLQVEGPPVLLIGRQTEPEGTLGTLGTTSGKPETFRYPALDTGLVKTLNLHIGASPTATSIRVGVREDNEGSPGAMLSETVIAGPFTENTTFPVTGLNAQVIQGKFYWLSVLPVGGIIKLRVTNSAEPGHTPSRKGKNTVSLISEENEWEADTSNGPMLFYGTGVRTPKGAAKLNLGANLSSSGTRIGTGTPKLSLGPSITITAKSPFTDRPHLSLGPSLRTIAERRASGPAAMSLGPGLFVNGVGTAVKTVNYLTGEPFILKDGTLSEDLEEAGLPFLQAFPATTPGAPLLIGVHPGGGVQGYPEEYKNMREAITQFVKGAVKTGKQTGAGVVFEYHLAGSTETWFPQGLENAVSAMEWVLAHIEELRANRNKIFIMGASAGGGLTELLVEALAAKGIQVAGVIELSPYIPDWQLLTEECEAANEAGESIGPLFNQSLVNTNSLVHHVQESLQQRLPPGTFGRLTSIAGTALTSEPASRTYQREWSPVQRPVTSTAKRLIISSEIEAIAPRQTENWQAHLITEGRWDARCKRRLRTASTNQAPTAENNYTELAAINSGKGHALAYLTASQEWPTVLSFIFSGEDNPRLNLGVGLSASGRRTGTGVAKMNTGPTLAVSATRTARVAMSTGPSLSAQGASTRTRAVPLALGPSLTTTATRTATVRLNLGPTLELEGRGKLQGRVSMRLGPTLGVLGFAPPPANLYTTIGSRTPYNTTIGSRTAYQTTIGSRTG